MIKARSLLPLLLTVASGGALEATDRSWENPVFDTPEEAVAAARVQLDRLDGESPRALRLFVDLVLTGGESGRDRGPSEVTREEVGNLLITHPTAFLGNAPQRSTIERFVNEVPRQRAVLEKRLSLFGYPETPGLVFCRLVDSVDAFADLNRASSDRMSQVGGVTYYCRYVVLPLSYVGERNVHELRRSAALNPSIDVDVTLRRWERESFANLINTYRHELVHVRTNSTLDVPRYSDRAAYPTWFHEGTATYLAADPRSGLSKGYQEFQGLFFYLAQRYGIDDLQRFFARVLGGTDVNTALAEVYEIAGTDQLFARSSRWHRVNDTVKTGLWVAALAIVVVAFRGADRPYIGGLQVVLSIALILAVATGLAEHLYGLRGPGVVMVAKAGIGVLALIIGGLGVRRIRRFEAKA